MIHWSSTFAACRSAENALASGEQYGRRWFSFLSGNGDLRKLLADALNSGRKSFDGAKLQQVAQYEEGYHDVQFNVGDLIWS